MASDEGSPPTVQNGEPLPVSSSQNTTDTSKKRLSSERESTDGIEDEPITKKQCTGSVETPPTPPTRASTSTPTMEAAVKEVVEEAIQEAETEKEQEQQEEQEKDKDKEMEDAPESEQQPAPSPQSAPAVVPKEIVEPLVEQELIYPEVDTTPSYDDDYVLQLKRSIALALEHIGFDGATKEAMESFAAEVDAYISRLMSLITKSALISRRSLPIPLDYEFGLVRMGLTGASLRPHLKPPIPAHKSKPTLIDPEPEPPAPVPTTSLLGPELDGAIDKASLRYIPKSFPAFPSRHTYKATPKLTDRETDPRKIREKATEAARHGEEALRRLVNVGKVGALGSRKKGKKSTKAKERQEMWEKTMKDLMKDPAGEEAGVIVNAEKPYWRQGSAPSRKAPPAVPEKPVEKV